MSSCLMLHTSHRSSYLVFLIVGIHFICPPASCLHSIPQVFISYVFSSLSSSFLQLDFSCLLPIWTLFLLFTSLVTFLQAPSSAFICFFNLTFASSSTFHQDFLAFILPSVFL